MDSELRTHECKRWTRISCGRISAICTRARVTRACRTYRRLSLLLTGMRRARERNLIGPLRIRQGRYAQREVASSKESAFTAR